MDSRLNQEWQNRENLLIDDGSTDGSPAICDEYEKNHSEVRVIHKENEGVSTARNLGIRESTGKYIHLCDADDWLVQAVQNWKTGVFDPRPYYHYLRNPDSVMNTFKIDKQSGKDLMGTFMSDIVLQILSFVAENERANIRQRQAEGIAVAKAKGVRFGRPIQPLPDNFESVYHQWKAGEITGVAAAKACGMPMSTFRYKAKVFEET